MDFYRVTTALFAVALAAAGTLASNHPSTPSASPRLGHQVQGSSDAVIPLSASFTSGSAGWLLGLPPCARQGCTTLLLRRTVNAGRSWTRLPQPPARLSVFPSVGYGQPPSGPSDGLLVTRMSVGGGRVFAVFTRPVRRGCPHSVCPAQLYSARIGASSFRPVPGTADADGRTSNVVVLHGRAYLGAWYGIWASGGVGRSRQALLTGPASAATRWRRLPVPGGCGQFGFYLATARNQLIAGCAGQPGGAGGVPMQQKWVWLSSNGGRTWRAATRPPTVPGYLTTLTAAGGVLAESGDRADVHLSWDGGRTWHTSPSLSAPYTGDGSSGLAATMVTGRFGYAFTGYLYDPRLFVTRDAGHTWTPELIY
jgi:hypothetical protein